MNRGESDAKAIFIAALEHAHGPDRAAYLASACGDDDGLRRRVEDLLAAHGRASDVLGPARDPAETAADAALTIPGAIEPHDSALTTAHAPASGDPEATTPLGGGLASGETLRYFGDYEIRHELGRGGMGVVYEARQVSLNRQVALKMVRAGLLADHDELRRFRNEAEAVASLDHPGIVPVYEVGEHDGQHFFSMKLIPGGSLGPLLDRYQGDPGAAARLVAEAADAVAHAHARGILHRDLKPANILVDDVGRPHVTDFGLAKRVEADVEFTQSGVMLGTPAYMSPEQAAGRRGSITTATDVYGLGAVLYALLAGRAPFGGGSVVETIDAVRNAPPEPPRRLNSAVPRDLEVICLKCLEKDPRRRYDSARSLADDLHRFLEGRPIAARPVGACARLWMWSRRNPILAATAAALAAALLGGTAVSTGFALRADAQKRRSDALALAASRQAAEAERQAELARRERDRAERLYNAAETNLMYRDAERADVASIRARLEALTPTGPDRPDLRGYEWHYMQASPQPELRVYGDEAPGGRAAVSPDLRHALTWEEDGTGRIRDIATGDEVAALQGPPGKVVALDFSADARRVYVRPEDGGIVVFDARTGRKLFDAEGTGDLRVPNLGQWLDGESPRAVVMGRDRVVRLWDVDAGRPLAELGRDVLQIAGGGFGLIAFVAHFSPDGRHLLTYDQGGTARLRDGKTGRERAALSGLSRGTNVRFSPDGRWLYAFGPTSIPGVATPSSRLWDAETGRELGARSESPIAFLPDGPRRVERQADGMVRYRDADTGREVGALRIPPSFWGRTRYSMDGRQVVAIGEDHVARVWDFATGRQLQVAPGIRERREDVSLHGFVFAPDGRTYAERRDGELQLWDSATGRELAAYMGRRFPSPAGFTPDGSRLVGSDADGNVCVWDASARGDARTPSSPAEGNTSLAFSPDGRLAATGNHYGTVRLRDAGTWRVLRVLRGHVDMIHKVVFSPDGRRLATAGDDRLAQIWDVATGRPLAAMPRHGGSVFDVSFSPDGRRLATASWDGTARVHDAETGRPLYTLQSDGQGTRRGFFLASFAPDGQTLATFDMNREDCVLRDAETGRELRALRTEAGALKSFAFAPDGQTLATLGMDGSVRLWDPQTGRMLTSLPGNVGSARGVVYSPDGRRLAGIDALKHEARVWDVATGRELCTLREAAADALWPMKFVPEGHRLPTIARGVRAWDVRPSTAEDRDRREARVVVRYLIDRVDSGAALREAIVGNPSISEPVRALALEEAGPAWDLRLDVAAEEAILRLEAAASRAAVMRRPDVPLVRDDFIRSLRADPALGPEARDRAERLARDRPLAAAQVVAAYQLVARPGMDPAVYETARRLVEEALTSEPDNSAVWDALGMAQYRCGLLREAAASLCRANALRDGDQVQAANLAFLAMALRRLGERGEARAALERFRLVMPTQESPNPRIIGLSSFLREAEALFSEADLLDAGFPADPFAPGR